jgi:glycine cleavage system aminomethyltransferase T
LNRLHTLGHVNRGLRGLCLEDSGGVLPQRGDKLFHEGKEMGSVTSAVTSLRWKKNIALGYVRREFNHVGTNLTVHTAGEYWPASIVSLPFDFSAGG